MSHLWRRTLLRYAPAAILVAAGLLAYSNAYSCVFVFDGVEFVRDSLDIRQLWPPVWARVNTRPVAMLTFALNYAVHGTEVWGYHVVNIAIHLTAGLLLFGIVRRTLETQPRLAAIAEDQSEAAPRRHTDRDGVVPIPGWSPATWPALAAALLWTVHPLQTQSVTYLYQRYESLMGLFVLASVYALIRGASGGDTPNAAGSRCEPAALLHPPSGRIGRGSGRGGVPETKVDPQAALPARSSRPSRGEGGFVTACFSWPAWFWYALSAACCLLAIGTKETAAVVPLVLLWCDRVFLAGGWREVFRRRGFLHGPLLAVLAGGIAYVALNQAWYAGGGILAYDKVSTLEYARSQPGVILHYLRLAFWPAGQCLDYGWPVARTAWQIVPPLLALGVLLALTVWAAWRQPALGFWGGWFFLFLAPTSSFAPIIDLAFEHRIYLPLAAVAVLVVLGFHWLTEQAFRPSRWAVRERQALRAVVLAVAIVSLVVVTHRRNEVYRSEVALWTDVVEKAPRNARGHYNLAHTLEDVHDFERARRHYSQAVELAPDDSVSHGNLANLLVRVNGDLEAALKHYRLALAADPESAAAHANLAAALAQTGRQDEALAHCRKAMEIDPRCVAARLHLGSLLAAIRPDEAVAHLRRALELNPKSAEAHNGLGNLLAATEPQTALDHYRSAIELMPNYAEAHFNRANLLVQHGQFAPAVAHLREAVRLRPDWPEARRNLLVLTGGG